MRIDESCNLNEQFANDISRLVVHRYTYEVIEQSARYLLERTKHRPYIGIICGSGLGIIEINKTAF